MRKQFNFALGFILLIWACHPQLGIDEGDLQWRRDNKTQLSDGSLLQELDPVAEHVLIDSSDIDWEANRFDTPPRILSWPVSTPEVTGEETPGQVRLLLYIGMNGHIQKYNILQSSGYAVYDNHAIQCAMDSQWEPAYKSGKPIGAWVILPVAYDFGQSKD
jgi:TonB family protein